jgi:hypothetical protein
VSEYTVSIPATARIDILVEAESEKEAIEKAWEVEYNLEVEEEGDIETVQIGEFQMHEQIVQGNVFSGVQNKVEVIKED